MMRTTILLLVIINVVAGQKTYFIPNLKVNWYKAYEFCLSMNQRLATIENKAENDALIELVKNSDKYGSFIRFWVGASDLAEEGTFTWTSSRKQLTFADWGPNEPNNKDGNENCLEFFHNSEWKGTGIWCWNDNVCEFEAYFICESHPTLPLSNC